MTARKAPERRQGKAGTTHDVGNVLELRGGKSKVPPAPRWPDKPLLKSTLESWSTFWRSGLARLVDPVDRPALDRLFRMYDERERADRQFAKTPFVEGSMGQIVAHPAARVIASLDERILKLEARFGLTPKSRMDLGIAFGAAAKSLEDVNAEWDEADDDDDHQDEGDLEDPRAAIDV